MTRSDDSHRRRCRPISGCRLGTIDGCSVPTRGRSTRHTCRATSTSSSTASTAADRAAEAWSSTGCSSSPSRTRRSVTATWWPTRGRSGHGPRRPEDGATHRAWTDHESLNRGERPDLRYSGQMNTPDPTYARHTPARGLAASLAALQPTFSVFGAMASKPTVSRVPHLRRLPNLSRRSPVTVQPRRWPVTTAAGGHRQLPVCHHVWPDT